MTTCSGTGRPSLLRSLIRRECALSGKRKGSPFRNGALAWVTSVARACRMVAAWYLLLSGCRPPRRTTATGADVCAGAATILFLCRELRNKKKGGSCLLFSVKFPQREVKFPQREVKFPQREVKFSRKGRKGLGQGFGKGRNERVFGKVKFFLGKSEVFAHEGRK